MLLLITDLHACPPFCYTLTVWSIKAKLLGGEYIFFGIFCTNCYNNRGLGENRELYRKISSEYGSGKLKKNESYV